ncbi:MAG: translation initiation factor [Duncaniella sp.]|nr:translation initiation factor [Duncaniella sp.]
MDWKDILAGKIADGTLDREEFTEPEPKQIKSADKLTVTIDRKGRKGKTATIIEGFTSSDAEVADLAAKLKARLGIGGSSRGGEILLQGDVAEKARAILREMGYKAK